MKTKFLLFTPVLLMLTALTVVGQDATNNKPSSENIPFGKKLPPPDVLSSPENSSQQRMPPNLNTTLMQAIKSHDKNAIKKALNNYGQQLKNQRIEESLRIPENNANANSSQANSNSNFHLTKDINALAESNPHNLPSIRIDIHWNGGNDSSSYAVLNNVAYFVANDGIHGDEFWRSDGTAAGTFMVKDIAPGGNSSRIFDITAANEKIYFTNYDYTAFGYGAWVSDGTESGTQLLINCQEPTKYFAMANKVYFLTDDEYGDQWSVIWETDGTTAGTKRLITLENFGAWISEPTVVNGLFFFTMYTYYNANGTDGWDVWRSDGTETGTYSIASFPYYDDIPAQFTNYNNKLYFSANDGTGRKLWVSDGTDAGTTPAPGNHDVIINADKLETTFPILNNVLYMPGEKASHGNGLYRYDAFNPSGLIKIKDFAPVGDTAFIVPLEMQVVNNTLYFKVTNYTGGIHDELWSSKGTQASTQLVNKFLTGETIKNLCNGSGTFYFVKYDKFLGAELWTTHETSFGTLATPVSDIFKGAPGSYPSYLTAFNGKLIFAAADEQKGDELFITGGTPFNTHPVKDINTVSTSTSDAGFNFFTAYGGMAGLGKDVLFNAYERVHGRELYKSDGTAAGTELLNDLVSGEAGFFIHDFLSKNNAVYLVAVSSSNNSLYNSGNKYS
ncbi:MAG TPA: ELWxxDGT repeat protein, partial [Parafilimonas sp.]|nr:ELWxxDGT repeat protein [Parafilimonas sp.]